MNLALEKGERVTTGGKGRGEIGGEAGEVTGVVANAPTTDGFGKSYGTFSGWKISLHPFLSQLSSDAIFVVCSHTFTLF